VTKISASQCVNLKPSPPITITAAGALLPGSKEWAAVDKNILDAEKKAAVGGPSSSGEGGKGKGGGGADTKPSKK